MGGRGTYARRLARREFLKVVSLGGVGVALGGCGSSGPASPPGPGRGVWLLSDVHASFTADGREGAGWLTAAVEDMRDHVQGVAYCLCLGDVTHESSESGLAAYAAVRDGSHFGRWYEIAGNHDFAAVRRGTYPRYAKTPLTAVVRDGNLAWFLVSTESAGSAGLISAERAGWLRTNIERVQRDHNVIVCTHHLVHDTVAESTHATRYLHPQQRVANLLASVRVDLWLSGHAHSRPRTPAFATTKGGTTYVNVASVSHAYDTGRANSCVLALTPGSGEALIRCRHHDGHEYLAGQDVAVTFPFPVRLGQPSDPLPEAPVAAAAGLGV